MRVNKPSSSRTVGSSLARAALALGVTLCAACDAASIDAPAGDVQLRPAPGGVKYDTNVLGTHEFSELNLTGKLTAGIRLVDVRVWPSKICVRIWWEDGTLWCEDEDGNVHALISLLHSLWTIKINGEAHKMTIADLKYVAERDHWLVRFEDLEGTPTCAADENGEHWALLYGGLTFDESDASFSKAPDILHIACTSGVLGAAGHARGWTPTSLGSLDAFQAAVRATALDACGDATPMAGLHVPFAAKDHAGISSFGPGAASTSEGVFGPEGMLCSGAELRTGPLSGPIKCGGEVIPTCTEQELAQVFASDSDLVWTKPDA